MHGEVPWVVALDTFEVIRGSEKQTALKCLEVTVKPEEAQNIQLRALDAIKELNAIAALALDWKADPALQAIRRALGATIWKIDREVLSVIYAEYPELNDLKDLDLAQFDNLFKN